MKKFYFLVLPILAMSLMACNNANSVENKSNIIVANEQYDENPYYFATCKLDRANPDSRVYSLFKIELNTDKVFTKSYLSSLISINSYHEDDFFDYVYSLTLAVQFDGSNITEYYLDFHQEDSSKVIKSTYSAFVIGDQVYPPYGRSIDFYGYYSNSSYLKDYEEMWNNVRLHDDFTIDSTKILPSYFPNGAYLVKESYATANNYNIVDL